MKRVILGFIVFLISSLFGLSNAVASNFSGNWQGSWTSYYSGSGGITTSIVQAGTSLSGNFDVTFTDCGNFYGLGLTGTVSGDIASFQASAICAADGSYNELKFTNAAIFGNTMAGNYAIYSDGNFWDSGYFNLTRPTGQKISRYRLYNPNNFHHHYTTDANEYNALAALGWIQEGTSCKIYDGFYRINSIETVPYYRLYNPNSFEHHWTTDANEYDVLGTIGWIQEGVDGYVFVSQVTGSEPMYRLYNPNNGLHHWTMDANERTVLIGSGWIDEGIACYVFSLSLTDLLGVYVLRDFFVIFDDGTSFTPKDVFSFSGTLEITNIGNVYQVVEVNGFEAVTNTTILDVKNNYIRVFSAGCTYDVGLNVSGNILTTYFPMGTCGSDYSETDVWEKISTSSTLVYRNSLYREIYNENAIANPGGSVGAIYNTMP